MTAPLRASDPIVVDVALGERSYDIVIGRGQLASLGARIAKLRPGAKLAIVSDENVAGHHLDAAVAAVEGAGVQAVDHRAAAGREHEVVRASRVALRRPDLARGSSAAISSSRSAAA